jgi:hypothetical protein
MSSTTRGEPGSSMGALPLRKRSQRSGRRTRSGRSAGWAARLAAMALAVGGLGVCATSAGAEETGAKTFPGTPLTVSVGSLGQCQSSYQNSGNNFYSPFSQAGDCGFFLAFPTAGKGQPVALQGTTWGFQGSAGPRLNNPTEGSDEYTPVSQSPVSGAGTAVSPYTQTTIFKVSSSGNDYALITETTTYVNGEPQFTSTYVVKNITAPATTLYFRGIYAGDLYVNGNDQGTGVFLAGPPTFIGGQNAGSGVLGGFIESSAPALQWSAYQEGFWNSQADPIDYSGPYSEGDNGIWNDVRTTVNQPQAFNDTLEPLLLDNAAGVEWDQLRESGLAAGAEQAFTIINHTQVPSALQFSPVNQTLTQGQTETITVTALDTANQPYAGKSVRYTVTGSNPQSGAVTLNAAGQAQISYIGHNAGSDTIQMFVDLGATGNQTPSDPTGTAQVTFLPAPPTPNSSYKVQSVKANSDGTITITFVPTQSGEATLTVTVPTGTIARNEAIAAKKAKKCKKGQTKIKGKCRPKITVSGSLSAPGTAGVPLNLTVKPSSKIRSALKKGKTVHLTATLTYKSSLGGAPTVQVYHLTAKGKKAKHHKKH